MHHPASLSSTFADATPWRTAALVAATIAAIELLLLVGVALAFAGRPLAREVEQAVKGERTKQRPMSQPAARATPSLPRHQTSVLVLNGNGMPGAAGENAERVRRLRYVVAGATNAPRSNFPRSIVMFRPGFRGEAVRLARDLRVRRVAPLDGLRAAELQGAHVALVLGRS